MFLMKWGSSSTTRTTKSLLLLALTRSVLTSSSSASLFTPANSYHLKLPPPALSFCLVSFSLSPHPPSFCCVALRLDVCLCCPSRYVLMEVLSKHEVAQNVLDYFVHHKVCDECIASPFRSARFQRLRGFTQRISLLLLGVVPLTLGWGRIGQAQARAREVQRDAGKDREVA